MSFTAQKQCVIIFLDCLIDRIQTVSVRLKFIDVFCCKVSRWLKTLTNHPFAECRNHFSCLKINKPKKIPRLDISLIIDQTLFQTGDRSGKITDACLLQTLIVKTLGQIIYFFWISTLYPQFGQ